MKKNTVKLNEQQLKKVIGESVKKVLKEWDDFKITDDFKLSDDMPFGTDKVTPGDSLPIISQAPRNDNRFNYFSDKEMLKLSIRNQIENKEGLKNSYSLKDLSKDIARRFKIDPVESFEMVKKIYKKIGGYHAIDENRIKIKESQLKKIVAESVKKVLNERFFPDTEEGNADFFAYERQIMSSINECDDCLLLGRIISMAADKLSSICREHRDEWSQKVGQWAEKVSRDSFTLEDYGD